MCQHCEMVGLTVTERFLMYILRKKLRIFNDLRHNCNFTVYFGDLHWGWTRRRVAQTNLAHSAIAKHIQKSPSHKFLALTTLAPHRSRMDNALDAACCCGCWEPSTSWVKSRLQYDSRLRLVHHELSTVHQSLTSGAAVRPTVGLGGIPSSYEHREVSRPPCR